MGAIIDKLNSLQPLMHTAKSLGAAANKPQVKPRANKNNQPATTAPTPKPSNPFYFPNGPEPGPLSGATIGGIKMKKGGSVGSASKRADGCATKGKTKGRII